MTEALMYLNDKRKIRLHMKEAGFLLNHLNLTIKNAHPIGWTLWCWHLPIFPGRHQPSIFGTTELNFCVRYGNRWTLSVINNNCLIVFSLENSIDYITVRSLCQHFFTIFSQTQNISIKGNYWQLNNSV